ncbi:MaoC family dehydratase N-terminal domain-containing protein [Dactylosporangium sp. CA-092794]|uniref:MaoC family dehydratase N-terminal domain-containing protein n=1 Tax=Dactylosporangium sp. CA-092794 TaxID=3239929 RepID=UPI003D8D773E
MPLNPDYVGRTFAAPEPYEVSREKIREFAEAIGDPQPAYVSAEAARKLGYPDVIAPPTFAVVLSARSGENPIFEPGMGMQYERVVHGEQSFVHHRPITVGDVLWVSSRIAAIEVAGRHERLRTETEIRTGDGELVCTSVNVLMSRGTAA